MKLHKVISGGQTGADITALECAKEIGLETGGWCPASARTEVGPNWDLVSKYGLVCTPFSGYEQRTILNVQDSEVTLWFGKTNSPGHYVTLKACKDNRKGFIKNPSESELRQAIDKFGIINFTGNRASGNPEVSQLVRNAFGIIKQVHIEQMVELAQLADDGNPHHD